VFLKEEAHTEERKEKKSKLKYFINVLLVSKFFSKVGAVQYKLGN
jgi:hypothetical protein